MLKSIIVQIVQTPSGSVIADPSEIPELQTVFKQYGVTHTSRLIQSDRSATEILDLEHAIDQDDTDSDPSLTAFWRLGVEHLETPINLLRTLRKLRGVVATAYFDSKAIEPSPVAMAANPHSPQQRYLQAAPVGVGAEVAWTIWPEADGSQTRFMDVERGWFLQHQDFAPAGRLRLLPNVHMDIRAGSIGHGTQVLGVVIAADNSMGVVGLAPHIDWATTASHYQSSDGSDGHVARAIYDLLYHIPTHTIQSGDVLLLEVSKDYAPTSNPNDAIAAPTEVDFHDFIAIRRAVRAGLVVVETAGNGNGRLDTIRFLNRRSSAFRDSRAIVVGGCMSNGIVGPNDRRNNISPPRLLTSPPAVGASSSGNRRWRYSNKPGCPQLPPNIAAKLGSSYGSRIDCHAWAEDVFTTTLGYGNASTYGGCFGGTSAAAAIVAGVACLVQSVRRHHGKQPLSSVQMRATLRRHGTAQSPDQARREYIGIMPDLNLVIPIALALP